MEINNGHKLMMIISTVMVFFMGIIYLLHYHLGLLSDYALLLGAYNLSANKSVLLYVFLIVPVFLLVISFLTYRRDKQAELLPLLLTLTFTFTSIGMIAGGRGFVEYHFSIFMMLALISYFRSIKLIAVSTVIFALQHFLGYFLFPELLCGTTDYRFTLLMIHAVYLILTAGANIVLIIHSNRSEKRTENIRNEAIKQYKHVVNQLQETSASILYVSAEVSDRAKETEEISSGFSSSSSTLQSGAEDLQGSVEENISYIENLLAVTKELNNNAEVVNKSTAQTTADVESGVECITDAEKQFSIVKGRVDRLENNIVQFIQTINQIGALVTEISNIADQTNLLALNASIEAARAGQAGSGFSVVAGEVRKLASESEASAHNIQNIVESINKESNMIYSEINHCVQEVKDGTESMHSAKSTFEAITQSIQAVMAEMEGVLQISGTLSKDGGKMNESMLQMSAFSESCLDSSHEITSASKLQFSGAASLTSVSATLRDEAAELEKLVQAFNANNIEV